MAATDLNEVIQHLRRIVLPRDGGGLTDGQLMDDFISRREETALAALIRRHSPMVWGVCLRTLGNNHDAEDAFQSTFLVFVRKAATVVPREMIGNWLYGVARQTALNARAIVARRRKKEQPVTDVPEPPLENKGHALLPHFDQELSRLPKKFRAVIVLCDLESKTRKEAARQLGLPEGTVATHLARGRQMLAKRLAKHGGELSGAAVAAVLCEKAALANAPPLVVSATIKIAASVAAGQAASGLISAQVAALTEGVLKTMLLKQLKVVLSILLVMGAVVTCGGGRLLTHNSAAAQQVEKPQADNGDKKPPLAKKMEASDDAKRNELFALRGVIVPANVVHISAGVSGRVTKVRVNVGDIVKANEILADLDDTRARLMTELAESKMGLTRARFMATRAGLADKDRLLSPGKEMLFVAEMEIQTAEAELRLAKYDLGGMQIRAASDGTVLARRVQVGDIVGLQQPNNAAVALFELADSRRLEVAVNVPERELGQISLGQKCQISVDAFLGKVFQGKVVRLAPVAEAGTVRAHVEFDLPEKNHHLIAGFTMRVGFLAKD